MAQVQFPSSPSDGDLYTVNNVTYTWNSTAGLWEANNATALADIFVEVAGDTMTGDLNLPNLAASGTGTFSGNVDIGSGNITLNSGGTSFFSNLVKIGGTTASPNIQLTGGGSAIFNSNISVLGNQGISYGGDFIKFTYSANTSIEEALQFTVNQDYPDSITKYLVYSEAGGNIRLGYNQYGLYYRVNNAAAALIVGPPSDYRLKTNVKESTYGTDAIKALRPVTYEFKEGDPELYGGSGVQIGFIADEANDAVPGAANGEKDGENYQTMNIYPVVATLTKALQESLTRIENLEASNAALAARLDAAGV